MSLLNLLLNILCGLHALVGELKYVDLFPSLSSKLKAEGCKSLSYRTYTLYSD
jgi:hypothetical protein